MTIADHVEVAPRPVSEDEVAFYERNGWAFLPGLIAPALAAELLRRAKTMMGERGDANELRPVVDQASNLFHTRYRPDLEDELYRSLRTNPTLGANAARLLGRDMRIRSLTNFIAVKLPRDLATDKLGKGPSDFHQDHGAMPYRGESLVYWIALDEVTPEMGAMSFYNGSQALGWLAGDPLSWPRLREFDLSPPVVYKPGDATVHGTLVVHGGPENTTSRPRWCYISNYFPDEAVYTGQPGRHTIGAEDGLVAGERFPEHPYYPTIYDPDG